MNAFHLVMSIWVVFNLMLHVAVMASAMRLVRSARSPAVRSLAIALMVVSASFIVAGTQRLGLQAVEAGLLPDAARTFLLDIWQVVLVVLGSVFAWYALARCRHAFRMLDQNQRLVTVLTERIPLAGAISEWGLTARELQVVELLADGVLSDAEIAEQLYIAPSTAATHVRNILRKAGAHNRREIMLIATQEDWPTSGE